MQVTNRTWTIRFGDQTSEVLGHEYYALIRDENGDPVDTFYGGIEDVFEGVGMLMASEASGTGLGTPTMAEVVAEHLREALPGVPIYTGVPTRESSETDE